MFDNTVVKVLTTQVGITGGGQDLEDAVIDGEEGHIEGATSQVVNDDLTLSALLVQPVGDGRGGGFVDDAEHVEASDGASILGGLTLSVVEVGGNTGSDGSGGAKKDRVDG